jgi:hypothetical protein
MATLSGNKIKDTYQSLVKFSDNGNITVGAKQLTDGFGNNSPLYLSTTQVGIGVTPESGLNLHVYGDAKIGSNLTVIGNLVVEGSTTTVGTDTLTVKDPLIVLANNNTSTDAVDIGFYGKYTPSGTTLYSGLFREALTGKYRLFKDLQVEPTTTVNTSGTGYAQATLIAALEGNVTGNVTGNLTGNVTGGTISGTTGTFSGNVDIDGTLDVDDVISVEGSAFGRIEIGGASGGYIDLKAPNSDDYDFRIITSSGGNEITTATGDLIFNTAETLALTIDTSQNANFEGELQIPSYIRHTGDTNTYIGFSANDTIDLVTASNVVLRIDSSNNATFSGDITAVSFTGNLTGNVTGNVTGDLTGNVTATSVLADGVTATTQSINDNSTKVATTAYVDAKVTAEDLDFAGTSGTGSVDLDSQTFTIAGTTNEISTSASNQTLTVGLPQNVTIQNELTVLSNIFVGEGANNEFDYIYADNNLFRIGYYSNAKTFEVNQTDFRVGSNHKVGIGTNNPQTLFEISNENIGTTTAPIIRINNVDSSLSDGQNLGSIEFYNDHTNLTTANIGVFNNTDGTIVKEMKFNLGSPYGDILTLDVNEINAIKRFTITGSGTTPRVTLANNAGEGALTYSLRSQDDGYFGIFQESSQVLTISQGGDVGINADPDNYSKKELVITAPDEGGITIASATDEAAYLDFSDGSGLKNFIRVDHDGDIFGYNSWGSHEFTLGEGVPSLTLESSGATFADNATFAGDVNIGKNESTATRQLTIGQGRTGNGFSFIDLVGDATYTDYGLRMLRGNGGANALSILEHRGTGAFEIKTAEAAPIVFETTGTEALRIDSSGNVGINETSPSSYFSPDLVVKAKADLGGITIRSNATSDNNYLMFADGTSGNAAYRGYVNYNHSADSMTFGSAAVARLTIDSSGNVGINETSPDALLDIEMTDTNTYDASAINTATLIAQTANTSNINNQASIISLRTTGWAGGTTGVVNIGAVQASGNASSADFVIQTRNAGTYGERMRIDSSGNATFTGNVIIGTSATTDAILNVAGNGETTSLLKLKSTHGNGNTYAFKSNGGNAEVLAIMDITAGNRIAALGQSEVSFATGGTTRLLINSSGNVGIGVTPYSHYTGYESLDIGNTTSLISNNTGTNVTNLLQNAYLNSGATAWVRKAADEANQFYMANGEFNFENAPSDTAGSAITWTRRLTIQAGGNVGIGTTSPTNAKLVISDTGANKISIDGGTSQNGMRWEAVGGANGFYLFNGTFGTAGFGLYNINTAQAPLWIQNGGNVGIGTTSPSYKLHVVGDQLIFGDLLLEGSANSFRTISMNTNDGSDNQTLSLCGGATSSSARGGRIDIQGNEASSGGGIVKIVAGNVSTGDIELYTANTSRLIVNNAGNVLVQATTSGGNGLSIRPNATAGTVQQIFNRASTTSDSYVFDFQNGGTTVGYIKYNNTSTSYATSSDYRLKENVVELTGALDRVSQLKPSRFNFISDADTTVDGFLAHEVQEIVPEAISGEKDGMRTEEYEVSPAVYENVVHPAEEAVYETIEHPAVEEELDDEKNIIVEGKEAYTEEVLVTEAKEEWTEKVLVSEKVMGTREVPDYQGIDQSKLVPLLVGAIQELKAEIESLKSQINN